MAFSSNKKRDYLLTIRNILNTKSHKILASIILSALCLAAVVYLSSYWSYQTTIGMIIGLLLIPLIFYKSNNDSHSDKAIATHDQTPNQDDQNELKLLLLTNDLKDRHLLLSHIDSWGINVVTSNSSLRAFAELVNHAESNSGFTTIIVDSLNLDMDPIQFAKYIQLDSYLSNIHLIHIAPEHSIEHKEQLLDAGYATLLTTPIDKTILFDALHSKKNCLTSDKNITQLISRYSSKSTVRQPLDILLAISDKADQEIFRAILEQDEQRVYTVNNGSQTLDALDTHLFDLVILDFNMRDIESVEIIRLHNYTNINEEWIPFIALVDEATPEVLSQCRGAEVNAILVRPVGEKELLITVADIASSRTKQAESIDKHWHPPHISETQIKDTGSNILNTQTLLQLKELSSSNNFLSQLTTKFNQDMDVLMDGLERSINDNSFTDFKDLIYAMKDSSCNLGADALHEISLLALQITQQDFQSQSRLVLKEIQETLAETKSDLQSYVIERDNSVSRKE